MNERLKQLSLMAGGSHYPSINPKLQQKFAELIVKECCDIFVKLRTRPADLAVKDVKKHFGVEE